MSTNAIQTTTNGNGLDAWQPRDLKEAHSLAQTISQSGLVPDALRNKAPDTLLVLLKGRELGLSVMQSLANIHVIKGKAELSAAMMRGLVMSRRDICEYLHIAESNADVCEIHTKRVGNPDVSKFRYTMVEAKAAGLDQANPAKTWQKFPAQMLLARCSAIACRAVYPDLVAGIYVEGEIEHDVVERGSAAADIASKLDPQKQVETTVAEVIDQPSEADLTELRQLVTTRAKQMGQKPREFGAALLEGYGVKAVEELDAAQVIDALAALRDRIENHEADAALAAE